MYTYITPLPLLLLLLCERREEKLCMAMAFFLSSGFFIALFFWVSYVEAGGVGCVSEMLGWVVRGLREGEGEGEGKSRVVYCSVM